MPESLLNILKVAFLALLWLFFLRVLRAVWAELKAPTVSAPVPSTTPAAVTTPVAPPPMAPPTRAAAASTATADTAVGKLLVVDAPEQRGQAFALADEITVGRGGGCGVPLRDKMVSQLHARIFKRDGQFYVEDLGSTNGTILNGKKVSAPSPIRRGDRLQVGKTVLELTK